MSHLEELRERLSDAMAHGDPGVSISFELAKASCDAIEKEEQSISKQPPVVYLREVDSGTPNECWVVCAKGDPGAVQFQPVQ